MLKMLWENVSAEWVIIVMGSIIGSLKANLNDIRKQSLLSRGTNCIVSSFCGVTVALHYSHNVTIWLCGLLALVTSSLAVSVLDALYDITPSITKKTIAKWFKHTP